MALERRGMFRAYIPFVFQTITLVFMMWGYASASEHRLTVMEQLLKSNQDAIDRLIKTQDILVAQLTTLEKIVNSQIVLEDYIHRVKGIN